MGVGHGSNIYIYIKTTVCVPPLSLHHDLQHSQHALGGDRTLVSSCQKIPACKIMLELRNISYAIDSQILNNGLIPTTQYASTHCVNVTSNKIANDKSDNLTLLCRGSLEGVVDLCLKWDFCLYQRIFPLLPLLPLKNLDFPSS